MLSSFKLRETLLAAVPVIAAVVGIVIDSPTIFWISDMAVVFVIVLYFYLDTEIGNTTGFAISSVVFILGLLLGNFVSQRSLEAELARNIGVLSPAEDDMPSFGYCEPLKQAPVIPGPKVLYVLLGTNTVMVTVFPLTILELNGVPVFGVDKDDSGKVIIRTLRLMDDQKTSIARFDQKGFWVSPSVRRERPDRSTLTIYDHLDNAVLKVRFMNPKVLRLEGVFRNGDGLKWTIQEKLEIGPNEAIASNNCLIDMWQNGTSRFVITGAPRGPY